MSPKIRRSGERGARGESPRLKRDQGAILLTVTQPICGAVQTLWPFIDFKHDQGTRLIVFASFASLQRRINNVVWPDVSPVGPVNRLSNTERKDWSLQRHARLKWRSSYSNNAPAFECKCAGCVSHGWLMLLHFRDPPKMPGQITSQGMDVVVLKSIARRHGCRCCRK